MMSLALLLVGVSLLLLGGAALVRGASGLAARLHISPLLVGSTIVAFGTSAPELVVSVVGAIRGETALPFGNVVGSNLANLGLVLGLAGLIHPVVMHGNLGRRELPLLLMASCIVLVMCADGLIGTAMSRLDRSDAVVLLILFAGFLYTTAKAGFAEREVSLQGISELPIAPLLHKRQRSWLYTLVGSITLGLGGYMTVAYGSKFALNLGIEPVLIGLLVVAIGTSLPELACSVIAALKNEPDLCIGNVLGSNLFNSLLVLPAGALIRPTATPPGGIADLSLSVLFTMMLITIFVVGRARLGRLASSLLLTVYIAYAAFRTQLT
jgi:cation:H+ antiporter